jgi:Zn-dependent protease
MLALKSLIRWSYALTTMLLSPAAIVVMVRMARMQTVGLAYCGILAGLLAVGLLSAMACWSTRRPTASRSTWAIGASFAYLAIGLLMLGGGRHFTFAGPELLLIAAGVGGLIVFSRDTTMSAPVVSAPVRPAPVAGDRTSLWFDRLATFFFMVATWKVMAAWYPWARAHHLHTFYGIPLLLLIAAVALVTAILHESGHALAARAFGMQLLGFSAGPFQWRKQEGKWKLKFKASGILGGTVQVLPTHPDQPAWHDICMVAAGPFTNICTGPIFLWAAFHAQGSTWQPVWFFLALMASFSLLVAGFNLVPFRSATGSYSDGARILQLLTNSPVVELQRAMRRLQSSAPHPAGA